MINNTFFDLFRKKGFHESLELLLDLGGEPTQKEFLKKMDEISYQNAFFRVKRDLLKYKLISYALDENNDYVIRITEKGTKVHNKIVEIQELMEG